MYGKGVLVVVILMVWAGFSLVSADTQAVPDLVGNWTGTSVGHYAGEEGFIDEGSFAYNFVIMNQTGLVFSGVLYETGIHGDLFYPFSGVIGHDMKTLYMADHDTGYNTGYLVEPDLMELILLVDGADGLAEVCSMKRE